VLLAWKPVSCSEATSESDNYVHFLSAKRSNALQLAALNQQESGKLFPLVRYGTINLKANLPATNLLPLTAFCGLLAREAFD
jgi:hypothetical protein